jgi:hypothetical protein
MRRPLPIETHPERPFAGPAAAESLDSTAGLKPESSMCHSGFEPTETGWLGRGKEGGILGGEREGIGFPRTILFASSFLSLSLDSP